MTRKGQPPDDVSSAPESGTVRGPTSGNNPSDRANRPGPDDRPPGTGTGSEKRPTDDPWLAAEER